MTVRILIVDDNVDHLTVASLHLKKADDMFTIKTATTVEEAIEILSNGKIDSIISDYRMPYKNGIMFLEEIRNQGIEIPFIVFTGHSREDVVIQALNLGADGYVIKGGDITSVYAELAHTIRKAVESHEMKTEIQRIFTNTPIAMLRFNLVNDALIFCEGNPAADHFLNVKCSEHVGKDILEVFPRLAKDNIPDKFREIARNGGIWISDQIEYDDEQNVTRAYRIHAIQTSPDRIVVSYLDLTQRAINEHNLGKHGSELEALVQERTEELANANRLLRDEIEERKSVISILDRERRAFKIVAESAIHSFNIRELSYQVLTGLIKTVDFDFGSIRLYNQDDESLELFALAGISREQLDSSSIKIENSRTIYAHVARTRTPVFAPDIFEHDIINSYKDRVEHLGLKSLISWPIIGSGGSLVGVISIGASSPKNISEDNRIFFDTLAGLLAVVLTRMDALEALRETQDKYRLLAEKSKDIILTMDMGFNFTYVSPAVEEVTGYSREEIMNKNIQEILIPVSFQEVLRTLGEALELEESVGRDGYDTPPLTLELIKKNEDIIIVEVSRVFLRDENEKPNGVLAIVRDISIRKEMENAIKRSERKLRDLLASIPEGIGVTDLSENLTFANLAFADILGYSIEELTGRNMSELVVESDRRILKEGTTLRIEGKSSTYKLQMIHKNGEIRIMRISAVPSYNDEGEIDGSISVIVDVTETTKAEEDLKKLSRAIEFNPASVVITDIDGTIEYVNPKFSEITGYSFEEVIGKNPKILQSGLTATQTYDELWDTIQSGKEWQGQFINKKKDGGLYWEDAFISPILYQNGKISHYVAVKQDITRRIQTEANLRASHRELELYTNLLRHDLANDLQVIISQSESAEILLPGDSMTRQFCEITKGAAERMYNLLSLIGQPKEKEEVSLETSFTELVNQMKRTHRDMHCNLVINDNAKDINLSGISLLPAIVGNLLRNAAEHSGKNVNVTLTISLDSGILEIVVEDDGPGIPEIIIDRLFQRGASTTGGGQGLYLSKRIVEGYGGSIELIKSSKKGAKFHIAIPLE